MKKLIIITTFPYIVFFNEFINILKHIYVSLLKSFVIILLHLFLSYYIKNFIPLCKNLNLINSDIYVINYYNLNVVMLYLI